MLRLSITVRITRDPEGPEELPPEQDVGIPTAAKHTNVASEADRAPQLQNTVSDDLPNPFANRKRLDGSLRLEKLSLERVPLSIAVCLRAIDWSILTSMRSLNPHYSLTKGGFPYVFL